MTDSPDLIVIGGGLHGCSAALHAALRGMSVTIIEKDSVGRHASGVNAGGVRRLGRHFAEVPISVRSMEIWRDIAALVDDDCGFVQAPQIKVAETEEELRTLSERADNLQRMGFDHEMVLGRDELRALLPEVAEHCVGGLASLEDGYAQPYRTTLAFCRKARSLGVTFEEGVRAQTVTPVGDVWRVETDAGTFHGGRLLNCAGAWAGEVAGQLREPVPVQPYAPMMIVTDRMAPFCRGVVGAAGRPLSFKQMDNGTVVIGGGRDGLPDPDTNGSGIAFGELRHTAATAICVFPIMAQARMMRCWAGIEARMPDNIPVLGRSSTHPGAFHAFGFCGHGFQLGPAVGEMMAKMITEDGEEALFESFSIARFQ